MSADVFAWRIATDTRDWEAHDLSGKGAEKTGGRWNRPGRPLVYAASSAALACLETVVHLNAGGLPLNRFLVRIEIPEKVWARRQERGEGRGANRLPVGWDAIPEGKVSLDCGDQWLESHKSALLLVPSVIVPEESNVLINPRHPDAALLRAAKVRPWRYDARLWH
jgi:RES domain-containing protein